VTQVCVSKSLDLLLWLFCILATGSVGLEALADDDIDGPIAEIGKKYSVSVSRVIPSSDTGDDQLVTAKPTTSEHLRTFLPILTSEFNLYPPELVKRSGVWRIVLCEKMTCHSGGCAGLADGPGHTVYLDPDCDSADERYRRQAIHHEFFHMIDYAACDYSDRTWPALNAKRFMYGSSGPAELNLDLPGFVSVSVT
jgi:hypothetical protein